MIAYLLAVDREQRDVVRLEVHSSAAGQPAPAAEKKDPHGAKPARSCRLPTGRPSSNSRGFLRIVSGLAENTHTIFCDSFHWSSRRHVRFCEEQEHRREAQVASWILESLVVARSSEARVRSVQFSLDKDLHGPRQSGSWTGSTPTNRDAFDHALSRKRIRSRSVPTNRAPAEVLTLGKCFGGHPALWATPQQKQASYRLAAPVQCNWQNPD